MRIMCWNCRGIGQPRTVQELVRLIREYKPILVFLSETRQNKDVMRASRDALVMPTVSPFVLRAKVVG
jgi:hypothetical protein